MWEMKRCFVCLRCLVVLLGVFMIGSVLGLGVSPARVTFDFEEGMSQEVFFDVVNSGEEDVEVVFGVGGDLGEYITLMEEGGLIFGGETKSFGYVLDLPDFLEPGVNTGEIIVSQVAGETSGSQISATLAVVSQVYVYAPYPGKYVSSKMNVYAGEADESVRFVISAVVVGEADLDSVLADVEIYDDEGDRVGSFSTDEVGVKRGERKELVYDWSEGFSAGDYVARVRLIWDGEVSDLEESFVVGREGLKLVDVRSRDFDLGEIVELEILIENNWDEEAQDVFVETVVLDEGEVVSDFMSPSHDVGALSEEVFVSYWDTSGVLEGDYDVQIFIRHGERVSKRDLRFEVGENELGVVGFGYVVSPEVEYRLGVFVIILVLAAVAFLAWLLFFKKKSVKKK